MSNFFQDGAAWLAGQLKSSAGREVAYVRGSQRATLTGWPANKEYEYIDDEGMPVLALSYDWTFELADLAFENGSEPFEPRASDRIRETLNGREVTYEAMRLGKRPAFEWLDAAETMVLVHTKRVT